MPGVGGLCGDDTRERIPQTLTEALTSSALETGQKQQHCVSVITRRVDGK